MMVSGAEHAARMFGRFRLKTAIILGLLFAGVSVGCAVHKPMQPTTVIATHSYVEFQPGWRLQVVVPILKSGGYNVKLQELKTENGTIQLKTPDDFVGYEIDRYAVKPRTDGGVTVEFQSAEIHMNGGNTSKRPEPRLRLFKLPEDVRYVRLAFLSRLSPTEHDAVILAASTRERMEALTARVEDNPSQACTTSMQEVCSWVPEGVSVQPQRKHGRKWVPAV
jgi:hypothetical protein